MANGLGDFDAGVTIYLKFTSVRADTGAPATLTSGAVSVYKDNSDVQSTSGITFSGDFDSTTGLNHVTIDLSADGTFYAAGSMFDVVITTGTVNSVSAVGYTVGQFSIRKNSALKPTTAARTLDVSAGGEAGLDWANIGSPTTAQNLSGTNIDTDQVVASVTGAVGSVTGAVGSVTGAVGSVAAGGITASSIATGAIDADALAADAVAEIADGVWDEDATGHQTQGTFGQAIGDPGADTDTIWGLVNTNLDAAVSSRLAPTVAARTLDVSAGGEAGIDWANIGSPTTAQNLSATNIDVDQIVASVSGAVGSVTGAVGSVTGDVGGNVTGSVGSLAAQAKADVNAEVVDVLTVDTFAQPGQEAPPATQTFEGMVAYLYKVLRNKVTQSATTFEVYADDGTTVDQKATVSDSAGTLTRGEIVSGP